MFASLKCHNFPLAQKFGESEIEMCQNLNQSFQINVKRLYAESSVAASQRQLFKQTLNIQRKK